jgi:tricorn protease
MNQLTRLTLLFLFPISLFAQNDPMIMQPSLSPDAQTIAFCYQGDIWTVPAIGGRAYRLTIHEGYDSRPIWSPDGTKIAFSSDRFGNADVFVMPATGGTPKRLTYHSAADFPTDWDTDKGIIFLTRRLYRQVEREAELYRVSVNGGTPHRYNEALTLDGQFSKDQKAIALVRGTCRPERETYYGPANRNVWVYLKDKEEYKQVTTYQGNDYQPRWGAERDLYYLSAESGKYNIYKRSFDEGYTSFSDAKRITNHKDFGIFSFNISADGKTLVYHKADAIYLQPVDGGKAQKVKIEISTDYRFDPILKKTYRNMEEYAVAPNGKRVAYAVHGEIFVTSMNKEDSRALRLTNSAARDREPTWLNDSTLLFISDEAGQYDLYAVTSADTNEIDLFNSLKHQIKKVVSKKEDILNLNLSPDGKQLCYRTGRGGLWVSDIDSAANLSNEKQLLDGWATPSGISWSPDSKWLAYSIDDLNFNEEIFIHSANDSLPPVNISMHPRPDRNPVWSPDGSKLFFTSNRNNGDTDIWFVWLKKEDYLKSMAEWKVDELEEEEDKKKKEKKEVIVQIDFEQIYDRLRQVTFMPGSEYGMQISKDGEMVYYISSANSGLNSGKDVALYEVKWDGKDNKQLTKTPVNALFMDREGKQLYMLQSAGNLQRMQLNNKKTEPIKAVAKMEIDYKAELDQLFEEGWRALNAGFYDPQFHGRDWDKLKETYKPMCMKASTKEDFQFLFNVMLGQLDASHMGMRGGMNPKETQSMRTGLIGVELKAEEDGVRVISILEGSPASKTDSKLFVGELIQKVNGKVVNLRTNFYELMDETAGGRVLLTVLDSSGQSRELVIWPVSNLSSELYEDWVQERKRLTEKYSNGRLGYIHIRGMNWPSFERFERELMVAGYGKEGVVIDVRYNGGGWTTDYLMTVLTVKQHAYTVPRGAADNLKKEHKRFEDYYPYGERLPLSSWTKPSIAMCNENSYSNAEIFSHAYKSLGIGTLVGKPTFGAVISTGGYGLIDGSYVRMPFRAWYVKNSHMNMEHGPAVPDIEVELSPDYKKNGVDEQLKKSVEVLLEQLQAKKKIKD